jgi:hypothetical protein
VAADPGRFLIAAEGPDGRVTLLTGWSDQGVFFDFTQDEQQPTSVGLTLHVEGVDPVTVTSHPGWQQMRRWEQRHRAGLDL